MSSSGLPALSIDPVGFGARANQEVTQSMLAQQSAPIELQQRQLQADQATALAPLALKEAQQKSRLQDIATANETLAQVAKDAQAADPADAPDIWDRGMKAAVAQGVANANQYIGHYRPDLAERVGDTYGGQGSGNGSKLAAAAAAQDQAGADRAVASMPAGQIQKSVGTFTAVENSWNKFRSNPSATADDLRAQVGFLRQQGIPVDQVFAGIDFSRSDPASYARNYAMANAAMQKLEASARPIYDAMQRRLGPMAIGAPAVAPVPLGTNQYIGTEPSTQFPVTINTVTGKEGVGNVPVGPKPAAAMSTFLLKQKMFADAGYSPTDALNLANGTKALPPERLQAMALEQANKELGDATLADAIIPNPDEWMRQKAAENLRVLTGSTAAARATPGGVGGAPPSALPPQALAVLKQNAGKRVTFGKNGTYVWRDGRAVKVQ